MSAVSACHVILRQHLVDERRQLHSASFRAASARSGRQGKMAALTALQEREQISLCVTRNGALKRGDKWFLLANRWWLEWVAHVDFEETGRLPGDARRPGPIDNSPLLENGQLRKGIVEDQVRPALPSPAPSRGYSILHLRPPYLARPLGRLRCEREARLYLHNDQPFLTPWPASSSSPLTHILLALPVMLAPLPAPLTDRHRTT